MNDDPIKKNVQIDLEIDTTQTDSSKNPFQTLIHLAHVVNEWRVLPRAFMITYLILLYKSTIWFMALPEPNTQQASLISIMTSIGAAWFGLYVNTRGDKDK